MAWTKPELDVANVERGTLRDAQEIPVWFIPSDKRKHHIEHMLPLSPLAQDIIEQLRRVNGSRPLVFSGMTIGLSTYYWNRTRARVMKETGGASFCEHDLRRSAATGLQRLGFPTHVVDAVLGHVQRGTGRPYLRYSYLAEKAEALNRWAAHIERVIASPADKGTLHTFGASA